MFFLLFLFLASKGLRRGFEGAWLRRDAFELVAFTVKPEKLIEKRTLAVIFEFAHKARVAVIFGVQNWPDLEKRHSGHEHVLGRRVVVPKIDLLDPSKGLRSPFLGDANFVHQRRERKVIQAEHVGRGTADQIEGDTLGVGISTQLLASPTRPEQR